MKKMFWRFGSLEITFSQLIKMVKLFLRSMNNWSINCIVKQKIREFWIFFGLNATFWHKATSL